MLTNTDLAYYPLPASAKSDAGIGVPYLTEAHAASFNAVFLCLQHCFAFMVGRVGVSSDTLTSVDQYANPARPATLRLASSGGGFEKTSTEDSQMSNTAQVASAIPTNTSAVFLKDGKAVTTSEHVAKIFKKEHYNVIRDIEKLDCSEKFTALNFEVCSKINHSAKNKPQKYYEMTRDGFTFLCMGYTGKEAARFKELYINRFNEMEKRLQEKNNTPDFEGRWVVSIEDGLPKSFSPIHPQAHIATPEEFAQRISNGCISNTDVSLLLQTCVAYLTGQKINATRSVEKKPNTKDKVELAKAFLNVVGHHGDRTRLAKELGIHTSTAQKVFSGLYGIANREVYGEE